MQGVNLELNSKAVETIKNDIDFNLSEQKIKLGVLGTAISAKVLTVISTKISAKTALKVKWKSCYKNSWSWKFCYCRRKCRIALWTRGCYL